jgi:hypothetical protein
MSLNIELSDADGKIILRSTKLDNLQVSTWQIERDGDCTYLDGGETVGYWKTKLIDTGMAALSKVPQIILNAVRSRLDTEINDTMLKPYVAQANELVEQLWPLLAGSSDGATGSSNKRAREDDLVSPQTGKKIKN